MKKKNPYSSFRLSASISSENTKMKRWTEIKNCTNELYDHQQSQNSLENQFIILIVRSSDRLTLMTYSLLVRWQRTSILPFLHATHTERSCLFLMRKKWFQISFPSWLSAASVDAYKKLSNYFEELIFIGNWCETLWLHSRSRRSLAD